MKPTEMTIFNKRQKYMLYIFVVIPFIFYLLKNVFQTHFILDYDSTFELISIGYVTYLYLLIPSAMIRLLNRKPLLKVTTIRIIFLHAIIIIIWLVLAKTALLGTDTNDWPPGILFVLPFFAANVAYYFVLTFPASDHMRPRIPTYLK